MIWREMGESREQKKKMREHTYSQNEENEWEMRSSRS